MDMHPLAIARCSDEGDVLRCLEFATKNRMDLAIRGGGHDVLAASTCNGGLVIDTSAMNQVSRTASGTCVAGAGARTGAINSFLQPMQLAVPLGDTPSVGVAGLTLGGGLGWLLGRYGTACDNLVRARIVLADGRILNVDQHEHPDLFWALRGGGGNFGLVTELEFKTHRVDKVMAGKVVYSGSNLTNFLHWFAEFRDSAPDDLTTELTVFGGDEPIILISVCYSGRSELADQAVAPLLKNFSPLADSLKWLDYAQVTDPDKKIGAVLKQFGPKLNSPPMSQPGSYWLGGTIPMLSQSSIDVIGDRVHAARGGWAFSLGHHMHGAACRLGANTTALPRRAGSYCFHFDSWWVSAGDAATQMAWVDEAMAEMAPHSIPTYINYLSDDHKSAVRDAYGNKFERLFQLKRRYDPNNLFHRNRNIS